MYPNLKEHGRIAIFLMILVIRQGKLLVKWRKFGEESMKTRFEGNSGRSRLIEVLRSQRIVEHNINLAEELAEKGELLQLPAGSILIEQQQEDNCIYFILYGKCNIYINNRLVATRSANECVGEMAVVDSSAPRAATVKTGDSTTVLKVREENLMEILNTYPVVWRAIAKVVAERLRQRADFHRPPNEKPRIFLGCSTENLSIAKEVQLSLKYAPFDLIPWTNGVFGPSLTALESLLTEVDKCDFAVFLFSPDDLVIARGIEQDAPRDNVIFELGLFMGKLERNRTFIIHEQGCKIKIPTDLWGLTTITYIKGKFDTLATEISKTVENIGLR